MLKVRKGYGPSQPNQFVPGIYLNPRIDEGAFGGQIGRSLQQLGGRLQADMDERKKKESDFLIRKAYTDEVLNSQLDLNARMTAAPLGAEGFTQQVLSDYGQRHSALVASLREQGVPEDQLEDFTIRLGGLQSTVVGQSLGFEEKSRIAKVGNDVGEMGVSLSQLALNDPSTMQAAIDEMHGAIDVLGLDAVNAQKLKDETSKTIRMSAAAGLAQQAPGEIVRLLAPSQAQSTDTLQFIRGEEGFRSTPYWDVNADRVGYGSDTVTLPDGTIKAVTRDMAVSKEDAERDLNRRVTQEFQPRIRSQIGEDAWAALMPGAQTALTSVAYNYGSLPNSVVAAAKNGDPMVLALAVEALPANPERRAREAALIRQGDVVTTSGRPIRYDTNGEPYSEKTVTFDINGKWYTFPSVDAEGKVQSEAEVKAYVEQYGTKDPITGERLPVFDTKEEAVAYAEERSATRIDDPLQGGKTGNPVLDALDAGERLQVLSAARTELNRQQVAARGALATDEGNASAALLSGMDYEGALPTRDRYYEAYGPDEGEQRWKAFEGVVQTGDFMKDMKTLSAGQITQNLAQMQPTDTASPTFAVEMEAWKAANDAAKLTLDAREKDPKQYVVQNYPGIAEMIEGQAEPKSINTALYTAYEQLGISPANRMPFAGSEANAYRERFTTLSPENQIIELSNLRSELGSMFYNGLGQLEKAGMNTEAYLAGLVSQSENHLLIAGNVLRGKKIMEQTPDRIPDPTPVREALMTGIGYEALDALQPSVQAAVIESAKALYVFNRGMPDTTNFDEDLFQDSLRQVLGGLPGDPTTGMADLGKGLVEARTILPPNTTSGQFQTWVGQLTDEKLLAMGGPTYEDGTPVTAEDVIDEGVFVRVGANTYTLLMGSDGAPLADSAPIPGKPRSEFLFNITEDLVKSEIQALALKPNAPYSGQTPTSFGLGRFSAREAIPRALGNIGRNMFNTEEPDAVLDTEP